METPDIQIARVLLSGEVLVLYWPLVGICGNPSLPVGFHSLDILACRFLCLKNKNSALVVFTTYTQKHPSIEDGPPFVQPLLNFIWFLLLAVDG